MLGLATKIGLGMMILNLVAQLLAYVQGAASPLLDATNHSLFALPALLLFDLTWYAMRCWLAS